MNSRGLALLDMQVKRLDLHRGAPVITLSRMKSSFCLSFLYVHEEESIISQPVCGQLFRFRSASPQLDCTNRELNNILDKYISY